MNSCENHVLACISEVNGPVGMNFGVVMYSHEWIIFFCLLSVDLKGQGHRSPVMNNSENHVLVCISEVNGPVGMNFSMVVYNHEWIIFCLLSVDLKGQGHRPNVRLKVWKSYVGYISKMNGPIEMNFVQFSSVQFSSVQFKMASMRSGKPICAPPHSSGVFVSSGS